MVPADYAHMANVHTAGFCAALLSRVDGDEEIFGELCDIFLDDAPKRLAAIRAALEARDARGVRAAAHAFKGAAGVFDATGIVDAARRLEQMGDQGRLEGSDAVFRELEVFSRILIDEIRATRETKIWKS
jgi:HPt (histidine-containing phosphotransfer) domain-containing protein